ncbi:type I polyketide synthase [Trichophyton rubrum]|uniref:Type I polyketide synthase n=1 Tax=Trichophyton rubrum TaxID=5551 RepID=A0A178EPG0_TRIRU|nr:type I polyketide synthase [Trichophyton rubrum]
MTSADVQTLDPQQRQLLECCYEALECGGIPLNQVANTMTGVYIGNFASDYESLAFKEPEKIQGMQVLDQRQHEHGLFLHNVCRPLRRAALRNGEIPAAFVGGVNLILTLEYHFAIGQIGALFPTAMCHAFDASADGYARGKSINVLYLKRVSNALRDGDPIRRIIRGVSLTAIGKNNGITLPGAMAQELYIRKAYEHSGLIDYNAVGFVECHGTGTPIGDPIETTAIANVFEDSRDWHVPSLSDQQSLRLNPSLDLRRGCLAVVTKNNPWPANKAKRASVNSTGYGGANGHVELETIEEYPKGSNVRLDTQAQFCVDPYTSILFPYRGIIPITISDPQLKPAPAWKLQDILLEPEETSGIGDVAFSQPACTAIQIALVDLLGKNPSAALAHGINTVLMNENPTKNLRFATLDLDHAAVSETTTAIKQTADIFLLVAKAQSREECETDFILKDGVTHISRVVPDAQLNEEFRLDNGDVRVDQDFPTSGNVQLALETPGLLDTVYFREQLTCDIDLDSDELEFNVKAVGLNMKDYVIAMGNFESVKSSIESTGVVSRIGANVKNIKPGDKVICFERGNYDTFLRSPVAKCLKPNDDDDLIEMATIGIALGTALYSLRYLAQLEAGETVLIQAATGGLGLAAIQYSKLVGAEIYATVGTQAKKEYLINELGFPENRIFWSRSLDFKQKLLKETKGRGADVVLSAVSGPGFY